MIHHHREFNLCSVANWRFESLGSVAVRLLLLILLLPEQPARRHTNETLRVHVPIARSPASNKSTTPRKRKRPPRASSPVPIFLLSVIILPPVLPPLAALWRSSGREGVCEEQTRFYTTVRRCLLTFPAPSGVGGSQFRLHHWDILAIGLGCSLSLSFALSLSRTSSNDKAPAHTGDTGMMSPYLKRTKALDITKPSLDCPLRTPLSMIPLSALSQRE